MPAIALPSVSSSSWRSSLRQPPDIEQVFSRYVEPIYRFLYARVGNREDAEDLTSEVFLKATRRLDGDREEGSIAKWLFTVARTVLADHWRQYYRTGAILPLDDERVGDLPEEASVPSQPGRAVNLVSDLLAQLPERYRRVLELRFLHGYSVLETAREMGVTPENAKVIQHRALAKAVQLGEGLL